jgi:hypothetical protein
MLRRSSVQICHFLKLSFAFIEWRDTAKNGINFMQKIEAETSWVIDKGKQDNVKRTSVEC